MAWVRHKPVSFLFLLFFAVSCRLFCKPSAYKVINFDSATKKQSSYPADSLESLWEKNQHAVQPVASNKQEEVYDLYCKANYYHSRSDSKNLCACLNQLHHLQPANHAYDLYAKVLYQTGDLAKVLTLPIYSQLNPDLDMSTLLIGASSFENLNFYEKSDEYFAYILEKYPNNEQANYYDILRFVKRQQVDTALGKLDQFLAKVNLRPRHMMFYDLKLALLLQKQSSNLDEAALLPVINDGLQLDPSNLKFLKLKFLLLEKQKDTQEANKVLLTLIDCYEDALCKKMLFSRWYKNKQYKLLWNKLKDRQATDMPTCYYKVMMLCLQKRWKEAKEVFKQAKDQNLLAMRDCRDLTSYFLRCRMLSCSDNVKAHAKMYLAKIGTHHLPSYKLAQYYLQKNKLDKAITCVQKSLCANPFSVKSAILKSTLLAQAQIKDLRLLFKTV